MDCTICGKPALPGAMLCAPCKAALKRARYVTVQEDMRRPSIIDVRRQPRRARKPVAAPEPSLPAQLPVAQESNANLGRRIFIGIFVLAAALGGASYFGLRELGARSHDDASTAPTPALELRQEITASVATPQNDEAAVASPVAASNDAPIAAPQAQSVTKPAGTAAVKRTLLTGRGSFATANGDPPDAVAPPPEPEKVAAAPPPPPPRPVPDRWQNMSDALAQCDREGVFGGLICGQRVRIQYCDGYWGKVAQCPSAASAYER